MSRRPPPERADEPLRWLKANGHDLGPLTGTDTRALLAIAACWRLYASTRGPTVILAVRELLRSVQPKCWGFAKSLIPWAMDWSDEQPVWELVADFIYNRDQGIAGAARAELDREKP